jgi:hypothetical protein
MSLKSLARQNYVNKSVINSTNPVGTGLAAPVITSLSICDSSYNVLDDTALDPAGSYVKINGTGFITGCTVYFNNATVTTTFVSSTEVRVQTPATSVGAYTLMLFNPNNLGGAIYLNLSVSSLPTFTTTAGSIGSYYEANTISNAITATGDTPLTYSLYSGSLPTGATLNSNGTITGTSPADSGTTTYSFVVNVKDAQNQDATRSFSLTINTDPVTWTTPASNGIVYTSYEYANISNVTLLASTGANKTITYSANALPGGITLSGNTISGSNNLVGNTYTRLTATAATTGRTNTRDVVFNVAPDIVTWSSPADTTQYVLAGGSAMANVSLVASSAAGQQLVYSANTLPAGTTISGNTIYGTPSTAQSVFTLLTATANVTNRSATRYISWVITLGDTYFKYTTLLLNGETTVTPFISDASNNNVSLTISGDSKGISFNPYQDGYYSNYFGGSDYLLPTASSAFTLGTGDFTIDGWVYSQNTTGANKGIFHLSTASALPAALQGLALAFYDAGGWNLYANSNYVVGGPAATFNTWYHFAVVRSGTTTKLYINGTLAITVTGDSTNYTGTYCAIGVYHSAPYIMTGYISNFRVVKGIALYTTTFTPSTTPLSAVSGTSLLTCQSNRFVDKSSNSLALTLNGTPKIVQGNPFGTLPSSITVNNGSSMYFNGSTDYLTLASDPGLAMSTGDFTVEFWFYTTNIAQTGYFIQTNTVSNTNALYINLSSSVLRVTNSTTVYASTPTLLSNTWYHIAAVRSGSSLVIYVNGVAGTAVNNTTDFTQNSCVIGGNNYLGYISNLRIVKGTAVYTGNFTPPTGPLAITQSAGTNIAALAVPTNGNSVYLGSTSDYLQVSSNAVFAFPGAFTVEGWFYWPAIPAAGSLVGVGAANGFQFYTDGSTYLGFNIFGSGNVCNTSSFPSRNVWHHIAMTRDGSNNCTIWVDGVSSATGTSSFSFVQGAWSIYGGSSNGGSGYISNLRVIKGTALYTSDFTPSTTPLTAITNTQLLTCQGTTFVDNSTNAFTITAAGSSYVNKKFSPFGYSAQLLTAQGTSIVDASATPITITASGAPKMLNVYPYTFTQSTTTITNTSTLGSVYYDGSGDQVTGTNSGFAFGSNDFTIECWVYFTVLNNDDSPLFLSVGNGGTSTGFQVYTDANHGWGVRSNYINIFTNASPPKTYQWYHVAYVRKSGTHNLYVNGVATPAASTTSISWTDTAFYSGLGGLGSAFTGYVSNVRLINGTALYTTNFVLPLTPLTPVANTQLLTFQTNGGGNNYGIIDNGTFNNIITRNGNATQGSFSPYSQTGWSTYFNGSADYLTLPSSSTAYNFGVSVDFTIEAWVYPTVLAGAMWGIIDARVSGATAAAWLLALVPSGGTYRLEFYNAGANDGTTSIPLNAWTHVAASRVGSNLRLYVNGILDTTITSYSGSISPGTTAPRVGTTKDASGTNYATTGYISNLRIVNGTGLYSSNFTPSTTPLTAIANTSLLTCQSNRFVDNSPNNFALTTSGTPSVQAFSPFGTVSESTPLTYSTYFNGSTDYLTVPSTIDHAFGTGDFTVEFWAYPTVNARQDWIDFDSGQGYRLLIMYYSNALGYYPANSLQITGPSLSLNTWYHIAVVRISGSSRMYVNGTQVGSTYADTTNYLAQPLSIGKDNAGSTYVTGYMSNVRITKGKGIYTGNFTVPTSPLAVTQSSSANTVALSIPTNGNSVYFKGGAADYLTVDARYGQLNLLGDFTVELWFCETDTTPSIPQFASGTSGGFACGINTIDGNATRKLDWRAYGSAPVYGVTAITTNVWHHAAYVKSGSTFRIFLDGKLEYYNGSYSTTFTSTATYIGSQNSGDAGYSFRGYISNFRVVKGTAVYTTSSTTVGTQVFTPSTTPLAVTQSSSANTAALLGVPTNGNSVYFNGSTDYITVPTNIDFKFGTGNYTIETWIYPTSVTGLRNIININAYTDGLLFRMNAAGLELYTNGTQRFVTTTGITINTWNHVALVRNTSGACTVYLNGTVHATFTDTASISPTTATVTIGMSAHNSSEFWVGYMSNLRVIKGAAVYTGAFTSPTAPLAVTQSSSANTAALAVVLTNGNSVYFNGSTDYMTVASNPALNFGSGDFTIEAWVYPNSIANDWFIISASGSGGFFFGLSAGQGYGWGRTATAWDYRVAGYDKINQWQHIAVTRSGTSMRLFFNGTQIGTTQTVSTAYDLGTTSTTIGSQGTSYYLNGYISNLRVVKGTALYTSSFTPSTTPLTAVANTRMLTCQTTTFVDNSNTNLIININGTPTIARTFSPFGNTASLLTCQANTIIDNSNNNSSITSFGVPTVSKTFSPFGNTASLLTCQGTIFGDNSNDSLGISATGSPYVNKAISPFGYSPQILLFNSPTIINNSSNTYTFTVNGSPKVYKYNPFGYTAQSATSYTPSLHGGSAYFDGTGDYLQIANNPIHASLSNNDFTIECWFYHTSLPSATQYILSHRVGAYVPFLFWTATSTLLLFVSSDNNSWNIINNQTLATLTPGQWYHLAYTRYGSTFRVFLNGVQVFTFTSSATFTATSNPLNVGASSTDTNAPFFGYITDVRMIRGISLYNSNFVLPSTPLTTSVTSGTSTYNAVVLLNNTNGGIVDQHGTNVLETVGNTQLAPEQPFAGSYYSNYFDGTGDYLTGASNTNLAMGTGQYTVEFWIYFTTVTATNEIFRTSTDSTSGRLAIYYSAGSLQLTATGGAGATSASYTFSAGQWYHVAGSRDSSNNQRLFVNGALLATATSTNDYSQTGFTLGAGQGSGNVNGYVSNLRLVRGTAVYTTAFTPSTTPLTAIANTSLLTCQSNKFIDNSTNAISITKAGDAAVKTFNPFQNNPGKSIYFDGTGDSLKIIDNPNINLGSGDFTLECWVYFNVVNAEQVIFSKGWQSSSAYASYLIYMTSAASLRFGASSSGGSWDIASERVIGTMTAGSWIHIAVTRSGTSFRAFVNGVINDAFTFTSASSLASIAAQTLFIGGRTDGSSTMNGYIDDLRITKGYARYTSNNQVDLTQTFQVK